MSVTEFSSTLRKRIGIVLKEKITRKTQSLKGFIGADTDKIKRLRTKLQAARYNNIILTKAGFNNILKKLEQYSGLDFQEYSDYMVYRKNNNTKLNSIEDMPSVLDKSGTKSNSNTSIKDPWTIINNTPYINLSRWTEEYLSLKGVSKEDIKNTLGDFESGHAVGLVSFRSLVSFGSSIDIDTDRVQIRDEKGTPDLAYFDRLNQLLIDMDIAATNSIQTDTGIYTHAIKDLKQGAQLYIELQLKRNEAGTGNSDTGEMLANLSKSMAQFARASAAGSTNINNEFQKIAEEVEKAKVSFTKVLSQYPKELKETAIQNLNDLINLRGSPSLKDHITSTITNTLSGKKTPYSTTVYPEVKLGTIEDPLKALKIEIKALAKTLKEVNAKVRKVVEKHNKRISPLRNKQGKFTSLASLQTLLNQALSIQIRKNMGTGSSRDVLNNRTGRLSESAKVDRMSQSREGMITAFYSYMKYPYATFSEGGRQELPRSRDPKLLISKSIRELASTMVGNRMRAVNI